ncbi:GGDEF domain-containing protein [Amycolatopsis balhimycina DSM 5908]|uniref:GGDEF domain-containing protein n=1 Tax=Amycolatopsis balhimycina DSM 5908 TaxID=1081091 RepID=A0A428WE86_AMYBA|nr:GGDEF domain-containing protein [Amycolatopsis balhimycina]RSM41415.1 GGDEF domain-containing protein [Amycolatopsis balhimycina DSM 5908]
MGNGSAAGQSGRRLPARFRPREWALWRRRRSLIAYCFLVETIAAAATVATSITTPPSWHDAGLLGLLVALGIAQAELGREVERMRRRVHGPPYINMTSVWTFAGVLLLPPALVAVLVAVLYAHLAARSWYRLRQVPPFRTILNATLVVLTCYSAAFVLARLGVGDMATALTSGGRGVAAVALAALTYFVVAAITIIPALTITTRSVKELFGGLGDNLLEAATLCLGMLTALALATLPALAVAILPPLLVLHRAVLIKQLEIAATTDEKTGLFNTTGWHLLASRELARAQRATRSTFGVLMIDLDHFKLINDEHGHLAGDEVLRAVAAAIKSAVRDYDSVGRFGGEEFVVLLPDIGPAAVLAVAERIRSAIEVLKVEYSDGREVRVIEGLSASIGVATYPDGGTAVDRLLQAADRALYRAKDAGRNQVVDGTATA